MLLAFGVRMYAANRLDVDFDEPVYLGAGNEYANAIRTGKYKLIAHIRHTFEHPALYKLLYGVALLTERPVEKFHESDLPRLAPIATVEAREWALTGRYVSVFLGTLAVATLAFLNPLAGFFLAIFTFSVKYTSEVYLEALPLLTSLLCVFAYLRWFESVHQKTFMSNSDVLWLSLSAVFLGMTAASKYVYSVAGITIAVHFLIALLQGQIPRRTFIFFIGWVCLSIFMFFVFNPYLWRHPWSRLLQTIAFHIKFQDSNIVMAYNYPFWQPLRWLSGLGIEQKALGSASAFIFRLDTFIFIFALIGLPRLFQQKRFYFYWLMIGLFFLLLWSTKWPQYVLIILVPFSIAAAEGVATVWEAAQRYVFHRQKQMEPQEYVQ
jgi:hypothetical protein